MSQRPPDIVIFNPDQWRGDVLGHAGNPAALTPNLDAFQQSEGVSFLNTYCQNPVCTPSRCSFMTGWYPHVRGHRTMHHMLHPDHGEPNLLKILKDNGYYIWWGGKNDLTPGQEPLDQYCDVKFRPSKEDFARWGYEPQESNHGGDRAWRGNRDGENFFSFQKGRLDTGGKDLYCDPDWQMVLGALDFVRSYQGESPVCVYIPIGYPHPPYGVEEPWFSAVDRDRLPPRRRFPEGGQGKPAMLTGIRENQGLKGWSEERWTELRATYYGMCARVDHQFGLLVDALKETQRYDQTALFFFSDHGDYTGDYGLVEKNQNTFEDCLTRVPFLMKPPAEVPLVPGTRTTLTELVDFSATVYDLTGIDPGYDSFGRNLVPLLADPKAEHRDAVFCEGGRRYGETQATERESWTRKGVGGEDGLYAPRVKLQITDSGPHHGKATMCRTATHKYVHRLYEQDELYDLINDPREERNLIADPEYAEVLGKLKTRLIEWYMETADVVPRHTDSR